MTTPELPPVSIFIPTYNDAVPLVACLESLGALDYPRRRAEIVVWDNASHDDTERRVVEAFDRMRGQGWLDLRLLRSPRNEGSYVIGCCWLLDRRAFREIGGFDPRFFINHWEVDYCLRLKRRGWRIRYEPRAVARHKIVPGGTRSPDRLYYLYRNKLLVIRTSGYFDRPVLAAVVAATGAAARIAADALATSSVRETG